MASRFFSRTPKAERRNTLLETLPMGGLIAVDTNIDAQASRVEHYQQPQPAAKSAQRPKPKPLDLSISTHNVYTASVLHDAALNSVSSASNLLAVVNNMLKSPLLVAHHKPLPPRPRSNTAPPTDEFIAELPGSLLQSNSGYPIEPKSASATDDEIRRIRLGLAHHSSVSTARTSQTAPPLTAPMDTSFFPPLPEIRKSMLTAPHLSTLNTPNGPSNSKLTLCSLDTNPASSSFESTGTIDTESSNMLQPSPLIVEKAGVRMPATMTRASLLGKRSTSYGGHVTHPALVSVSSFEGFQQIEQLKSTLTAQKHTISTLTDQFASLKNSHEAHIDSLVDAHSKEMESLKTYIEGLEQRQDKIQTLHHDQNTQHLQVSKEIQTGSPLPSPAVPPKDARGSKEEDRVRREYSKLKKKIETANSQTVAIMNQLENARKQESAFRNEVQALEARLEGSNAEKVDALEAAYGYEQEIKQLHKRQRNLIKENEEMRVEAVQAQTQGLAGKLQDSQAKIWELESQLRIANQRRPEEDAVAAFVRQIEDLQGKIKEKDSDNRRLKKENDNFRLEIDDAEHRVREMMIVNEKLIQEPSHGQLEKAKRELSELKARCAKQDDAMAKMQLKSEEYYRLLKAEIKKKACKRQECLEDGHLDPTLYPLSSSGMSPKEKERMLARETRETRSKAAAILGLDDDSKDLPAQVKLLEKENDYHVRDIVSYQVAVSNYEKEARRFAARLRKRDELLQQLAHGQQSPSYPPDRRASVMTPAATPSKGFSTASTSPRTPQTVQTTPGTPYSATTTPMSTTTHRSSISSTPQSVKGHRQSLSIHKKLPKPPPLSPPETTGHDYLGKSPTGLGIISHVVPGSPKVSKKPSLTPVRESNTPIDLQQKKSRRSMSESVINYPNTPITQSPTIEENVSPSSSNSSRRPSLPVEATDPPSWIQTRKAAVRANVLARAENEPKSHSPVRHLTHTLRNMRSKPQMKSTHKLEVPVAGYS